MPKYQATSYIRLSYTDDRSSESDSVTNQRKLIENFIERNPDIEIISEKIDDGYSGIIFDRPAFKEMMQDTVTAQAKLKQEEQARQSNRQEIVHSIAEADALTSELTDLLIEKVYVFPDNRIEIVYKVHDLFE